jgi:uncharacterized FAD-dependent dehydrogenase
MQKEITVSVKPEEASDSTIIEKYISEHTGINPENINHYSLQKKSIDARSGKVKFLLTFKLYIDEPGPVSIVKRIYPDVSKKEKVIVVGAGPAGLFASLKLIESGLKPIIIERGKDISGRKIDIAAINKEQQVDPDSNYCFGEGGAGTFSDGKLYTRSTKKGNVRDILEILVEHGANENILSDSHPHIGSDKLPKIISDIRETIVNCGGEYHFNQKVKDFIIEDSEIKGVVTGNSDFCGVSVILATGHSADDIYHLLNDRKILLEAKPYAIGVRVEHPQELIDSIQYHMPFRGRYLPAATYNLVQQVNGRGVFSFCMCPGGIIVPSTTNNNQVVLNGMSNSLRNSPFANSGIVVSLEINDFDKYKQYGPLAGLYFQREIEKAAFMASGRSQAAPAQRMVDFVGNRISADLPEVSYKPGIKSVALKNILPSFITSRLSAAFKEFDKKMRGFYTNEAVLLGVESRTSSPVRIPRDKVKLEHTQISNLYPCGEGSGYAGGIVSSAIDGVRCVEKIAAKFA